MSMNEREKAFENKYKHDEELRFRVEVKAAKLMGAWVGAQLGHAGEALDAYAKEVATTQMEEAGNDDVIRKVEADLKAAGKPASTHALNAKMEECMNEAKRLVMGEN